MAAETFRANKARNLLRGGAAKLGLVIAKAQEIASASPCDGKTLSIVSPKDAMLMAEREPIVSLGA